MPESRDRVYFPGLNGIRALAALSVLIAHIYEYQWRFGLMIVPGPQRLTLNGINAVVMFFVLSGFLITYLLLSEIQKSGTVSVRNFYARRILRIWPVYYVTIFVGLVVVPLIVQASGFQGFYEGLNKPGIQSLLYVLLIPNAVGFFGGSAVTLVQLWSIGIEEQFYLLWPLLARWFGQRLHIVLIVIIVFKILWNQFYLLAFPLHFEETFRNLVAFINGLRFENMAVGGLGAYLLFHRHVLLKLIFHPVVEKLTLAFMIFNAFFFNPPDDPSINLLLCLPYIIFILNVSSNPRSTLKMENWLFNWLGKLSYGIYMYHLAIVYLMFLMFSYMNVKQWNPGVFTSVAYISITAVTLLVADLSYRWYEKPFLRLKKRFTVIRSGHVEAVDLVPEPKIAST